MRVQMNRALSELFCRAGAALVVLGMVLAPVAMAAPNRAAPLAEEDESAPQSCVTADGVRLGQRHHQSRAARLDPEWSSRGDRARRVAHHSLTAGTEASAPLSLLKTPLRC
jgi:hypothetical protein